MTAGTELLEVIGLHTDATTATASASPFSGECCALSSSSSSISRAAGAGACKVDLLVDAVQRTAAALREDRIPLDVISAPKGRDFARC